MNDVGKLKAVFKSTLGLGDDSHVDTAAYGTTAAWDSVAHMQLVAAIEDAFGIMLETDDVIALSSYEVAATILRTKYHIALDA